MISSSSIAETLGHISNQLADMQRSICSLSEKIEEVSKKTEDVANRVSSIEQNTLNEPVQKRKPEVPHELSVSKIPTLILLQQKKDWALPNEIINKNYYNVIIFSC